MANLKALSIGFASVTLIACSLVEHQAASFNPAPAFNNVGKYSATISQNNNVADIYFPQPSDLKTGNYSFPVVLLLQGANVDKSNYSKFASIVARYGFVVVVPNSPKSIPERKVKGLFTDTSQINAVLAQISRENTNPTSPVKGIVNSEKLGLLGHSYGGVVGLSAIANLCLKSLCGGSFNRPQELAAGAFFGTNLRQPATNEFIPIKNSGIPIALLQGTVDNIALPERTQATYDKIQDPPKISIAILGANHYGINNTNNPIGARSDTNTPTLNQDVGIETIARWSGLFLRASILNDKQAFTYVYSTGDDLDPNVTAIAQTKTIPKVSYTWGLVLLGIGAIAVAWKQWRWMVNLPNRPLNQGN